MPLLAIAAPLFLRLESTAAPFPPAVPRGSLDPRPRAAVSLALGSAHFQAGGLADAEAASRAPSRRTPRSGDAHNNLAVVLMLRGQLDDAQREVRLAEKARVSVSPRIKDEIRRRAIP